MRTDACVFFYLRPAGLKLDGILERVQRGILQQAVENSISHSVSVYVCACIHTSKYNLLTVLFLRTGDIYTSGTLF